MRRQRNAATGHTPSYILLGKTISLPGEWRVQDPPKIHETGNLAEDRQQRETTAHQHQEQYQRKYTDETPEPRYNVEDWVVTTNHQLSNKAARYNAALDRRRIGPYQIIRHVAGDVYDIQKDGQSQKVHRKDLWPAPRQINYQQASEVGEEPPLTKEALSSQNEGKYPSAAPPRATAFSIGEEPYSTMLVRAPQVPAQDIHAPGLSALLRLQAEPRHAFSIGEEPYLTTIVRAPQVPAEDMYAPGPSGLLRPQAEPRPASRIGEEPCPTTLVRATQVPVKGRHKSGPPGPIHLPTVARTDHSVAVKAPTYGTEGDFYTDSSQEDLDDTRGRYKLRSRRLANYLEARPYTRHVNNRP